MLDLVIYPSVRKLAFVPYSFLFLKRGYCHWLVAGKQGRRALHGRKGKRGVRGGSELSPVPLESLTCQAPIDGVVAVVRPPATYYQFAQALH